MFFSTIYSYSSKSLVVPGGLDGLYIISTIMSGTGVNSTKGASIIALQLVPDIARALTKQLDDNLTGQV